MNFFLFVLTFISLPSLAIVENGIPATEEDLSQTGTVAIVYEVNGKDKSSCTGVRVAPRLILTAAHCVYNPFLFPKGVRAALNPLDQDVPLEKIKALQFPFSDFYYRINFEHGYLDDIALLELEDEFNGFMPEIAHPQLNDQFLQLGYGMDYHYPRKDIFNLTKLENGKLDSEEKLTPFHFTIRNPGSSMRSGDSGGPIFIREDGILKLAGILSSGDPNPLSNIKSGRTIYLNAYYFINWIRHLSQDSEFNSQFPNPTDQYPLEAREFITARNNTKVHHRLCHEMRFKLGAEWYLSENGTCLPKDHQICEKMQKGQINGRFFSVKWNPTNRKCENI